MTIRAPFKPHYGSNQSVSSIGAASTVAISKFDKSVRIVNSGANLAYFRVGVSSDTTLASAADVPILPSTSIVIEKEMDFNLISHISPIGTTLHIMTGEGGI